MQTPSSLSRAHVEDPNARRYRAGGLYDWSPPRSPEADRAYPGNRGMYSARPFWSCGYCGSMHPTELVEVLAAGASGSWADFKYGWPHKWYVENAPNPYAGRWEVRSGEFTSTLRPGEEKDWERYPDGLDSVTGNPKWSYRRLGAASKASERTHGKFYTIHLVDATPEEKTAIESAMGLSFIFDEKGGVRWEPVS